MNGKSLSIVCFSRCVLSLHFPSTSSPPLRVALRETRLIDPGDGSEKIPHQCETLPWFRLSRDPWLRVTGTVGIFFTPLPSAPFLSSVAPRHSHVGLHHVCRPSHTIPALLRAEAALRA